MPRGMEDKWFIFYEDYWLYFHRPSTGDAMYKAQIHEEENGYAIREFYANQRSASLPAEVIAKIEERDLEFFSFLISRVLLGEDVAQLYIKKNLNSDIKQVAAWFYLGHLLHSKQGIDFTDKIKAVLTGVAVGDALGVPVEFKTRQEIKKNPVTDMMGYGTYPVPPGTFSDDSSMSFCLAEVLTEKFDLNLIGKNFVKWYTRNYWTATGHAFDIGLATRKAIEKISEGVSPDLAGGADVSSNGNGSLMRIAPLLFYVIENPVEERFEITRQVSSITHRHIRSVIACFYYLEFAYQLLEGRDKLEIYNNLKIGMPEFLNSISIDPNEIAEFDRLLKQNIYELPENKISSGGYVVHTLEACIWCLLKTDNYRDAVLRAVNLGEDTDTTAAVTGGLAGLLYGLEGIPEAWRKQLARADDIENLAERLGERIFYDY